MKAASFALIASVLASAIPPARAAEKKDIVETAVAAGQFHTLATALRAAGLADTLKSGGPFTVFAPTDDAFKKLPPGALDNLLKPESKEKLKEILLYHVVSGQLTSAQVAKLMSAKTLAGQNVRISAGQQGVMIDNARVVQPDVAASNGIIHAIDTVLLPKN